MITAETPDGAPLTQRAAHESFHGRSIKLQLWCDDHEPPCLTAYAPLGCMCVHMMNTPKFDETTSYGLLKILEENPSLSQRDLASHLGISLGKVNFCLKALIEKGCLKVNNFRNSNNKLAYAYLLTPHGVEERARMTSVFLQYKMHEYDRLRAEIDELKNEVERQEGET